MAGLLFASTWPARHGQGNSRAIAAILSGASLLALIPAAWLFPRFDGDALYFGTGIYDHIKTAVIDTIAREGFPPRTPYLSLDGAAVALNYYYGWHLLAAGLRTLPGVSSLGADIGLTWFTAAASASAVAGLAWHLRPNLSTVIATFAVLAGATFAGVARETLPDWLTELFLARGHPIEGYMIQAPWVPQHLASATFVMLALFCVARLIDGAEPTQRSRYALCIGLLLAAGVMSSAWAGGIALAATAVLALPLVYRDDLLRTRLMSLAAPLLLAALAALVLAGGYLLYLRGLSQSAAQSLSYLGFGLYRTSQSVAPDGPLGALFQAVNYVTVYGIVHLGLAYGAGLVALYVLPPPGGTLSNLQRLTRIWVPATFVMVLLVRSPLVHNDLGWRGILAAVLLLAAFAGTALAALWDRLRQGPAPRRLWIVAGLAAMLGALSLAGTHRELGQFVLSPLSSIQRDQHTRMLAAGQAWQRVQVLTRADAIVMAGPSAFSAVTRPSGNIAWALFGDRRLLLTDYEWGLIFAHHVREAAVAALDKLQSDIFDGTAHSDEVARLKTHHKVSAILVAPTDAIAGTNFLTSAGHFRHAETVRGFEIFLATPP